MGRGGRRAGAGRKTGTRGKQQRTIDKEIGIGRAREKVRHRAELTETRVLEELRRIVFFNPQRLFTPDGHLKHPKDWHPEDAACLAGFEVIIKNAAAGDNHTDTIHKVKWIDKGRLLELAMKHLGLLTEKVELTGDADFVAALHAARQRLVDAKPR